VDDWFDELRDELIDNCLANRLMIGTANCSKPAREAGSLSVRFMRAILVSDCGHIEHAQLLKGLHAISTATRSRSGTPANAPLLNCRFASSATCVQSFSGMATDN
jgi:hypothetical protein